MSSRRMWIAALACTALAACNTANTHIGDLDPGMGEATKYNAAIQTINPAPVYAADGAQPGDNGDKGAAAVKRYRTGSVKEPAAVSTSSGGGGGSSSGGGPQ